MVEGIFCAQLSEERQVPIYGLAPLARIWVLVEYTGAWERSAVLYNDLPEPARRWLAEVALSYETRQSMAVFIRRGPRSSGPLRCFVAITLPERQALYAFQLASYEELPLLPLDQLEQGAPDYDCYLSAEPLYIVCTHGKHDQCCAKFGMPIYREAARLAGEQVWQCSHIGGDQFAANLVCLPHGIYYSRVKVPEVAAILEADRQGKLYLEKCRGRAIYPQPVQAAEHYLRQRTGQHELTAFIFLKARQDGAYHRVLFRSRLDGSLHSLRLVEQNQALATVEGCRCNLSGKLQRQEYCLLEHRIYIPQVQQAAVS
ncbi:sucrase ferredoxin [Thermogemmatispora onikobensis]|uniref:sucrase ferredoxin n=1 Tax=Thermogemmatispora onikobensis TaxID=732234 RepID=UPI000852A04C|nr:sucrase ferredoxin [Thermogemmatispora onikobensis]